MRKRFGSIATATVFTTYLLIVVGALVRASGAGMGCPDWPQCFGRWTPPTSLAEVPAALVPYFNVRLAWTEYLNRLLGTTTGLLVITTLAFAWIEHRRDRRVLGSSSLAFLAVGLAGWLGKRVVERHLDPALVTLHMYVALTTLALLLDAVLASRRIAQGRPSRAPLPPRPMFLFTLVTMALVLAQIGLGTRVRASLEAVAAGSPGLARGAWLAHLGSLDITHRTLATLVLAAAAGLAVYARRAHEDRAVQRWALAVPLTISVQILVGVGLAYASLPPVLQILHVSIASAVFAELFVLATFARHAGEISQAAPLAVPDAVESVRTADARSS